MIIALWVFAVLGMAFTATVIGSAAAVLVILGARDIARALRRTLAARRAVRGGACAFCTIGGGGKRCTCTDVCEEMFCMAGRTVGSRD